MPLVLKRRWQLKLFAILAHPDVFMTLYPRWDEACEAATRRIAQAALEYDVILEVNANGLRRGKQTYRRWRPLSLSI